VSIKVQCPKGHFVAIVDVTEAGLSFYGERCGLSVLYAPKQKIGRLRARCFSGRCTYDGSIEYWALCAELARAVARGDTKHKLSH